MSRKLDITITDERREWLSDRWVDDDRVRVQVECTSYTCPICRQRKFMFTVNDSIVKGGKATTGINGNWISHCGSAKCHRKVERMCYGWRLFLQEQIRDFRHWLSWRLAYLVCKLRREKWYPLEGYTAPGNRAAQLQQSIWEDVVISAKEPSDCQPIDEKLTELGRMAGAMWGHYDPNDKADKKP